MSCPVLFAVTAVIPAVPQEAATVLDAPVVFVSSYHRIDHLLDLNGDGVKDFAVVSRSSSQADYFVLLNDGNGTFSTGLGGGVRTDRPWDLHVSSCDGNMDGKEDLLFWASSPTGGSGLVGGKIQVMAHDSGLQGHFIDHLGYDGGRVDFVDVFDVDLDGDADRVRVAGSHLSLDRFAQDAAGTWQVSTTTLTLPFIPQEMVRLDYDGDAHPDLYLHASRRGIFVPLAGGQLNAPIVLNHDISAAKPMAIAGDVDGDGDEDLALFDEDGYELVRRLGPTSWALEPRRVGGPAAKLADVDQDGDLDGICCGGSGDTNEIFSSPSTFYVSLNDGDGNFAPAFTIPGLGSREIAGAADLDGDGDVDLAAGQCVYYAHGPLKGPPQRALTSVQSSRSLFDFDRDGDLDYMPGLGSFGRNLGNGRASPATLLCSAPPAGMSDEGPGLHGDWDGDGDQDLLVRRWNGTLFVEMRLLLNEGGGTFTDGGAASAVDFLPGVSGVRSEDSFAVDLDLDGDLDLVTTHRGVSRPEHWTRTWLNDGSGHFAPAWQVTGDWALAFAQLTGTAVPDVIFAHQPFGGFYAQYQYDIYLHAGLGTGAFEAVSMFSARLGSSLGAAGIAIADFDRDGELDLAGAFEFGGYSSEYGMAWFLPNRGGSFSLDDKVLLERLEHGTYYSPLRSLARVAHAVDVDGDGLMDVVLSSPENRRAAISIVRRASDNSGWLPPIRQVVFPVDPGDATNVVAQAGTWKDLDGDGDAEFVTDVVWDGTRNAPDEWGTRRQDVSGVPDGEGRIPVLGVSGQLRAGHQLYLRLTNVPPGTVGVLEVAGARLDAHRWPLLDRFFPVQALVTSGMLPGSGTWTRSLLIPPSYMGAEHRLRVELVDPTDPSRRLCSNELSLSFGH